MEIKEQNIRAAYNAADESQKTLLRSLFPDLSLGQNEPDNRPVTERIKTFEDACATLGIDAFTEEEKYEGMMPDEVAYQKLRIICQALNEEWTPKFTKDEVRWYPWHWLYDDEEIADMDDEEKADRHFMTTGEYVTEYAGFAYAHSYYAPSGTFAYFGSRLCLKSDALATYCGKQFIRLWADFKLIRR